MKYEYKVKFEHYDLEEFSDALFDCAEILSELVDSEGVEEFKNDLIKIINDINDIQKKIDNKIEYNNMTKEDYEAMRADLDEGRCQAFFIGGRKKEE